MDMKSISQKLQNDIRAILEATLHPNQQKIDVHEPEKDEITAHDFKKLRAMKKTKDGKVHNCATHVEHAILGRGTTVSEEHAEPDANGDIEWYTVQFENSVQKVLTKDLTILVSESHMHESEQIDEISTKLLAKAAHSASDPMKHYDDDEKYHDPQKFADHAAKRKDAKSAAAVQGAANAKGHYPRPGHSTGVYDKLAHRTPARVTAAGKANKQDVNTLKKNIRNEDVEVNEAEAKKPSPFDWKNTPSMLNKKPGEKAGFESKKISTGTVYTKKPVKESYTFADYLDAAREQYGDDEAVRIANEAFKNQDITLFTKQSQSPEA